MSLTSKQIDELRAYAKDRKGELAKMINDAADTIELLSAKLYASQMERSSQYYHGGWIPVSERLPEKYGWYLCTLKDTRVNTYYWNNKGEWVDNGKKHFFELYNISGRYTGENITAEQEGSVYWTDWVIAWMPLPEPYRGEGDE